MSTSVSTDNAYTRIVARDGIEQWQPPEVVLSEVGVRRKDIDTVLVTHAHFDHFRQRPVVPNATFHMQERELTKWVWALALPPTTSFLTTAIDPDDVLRGVGAGQSGQAALVYGDVSGLLPGINAWAAHDTHTYGRWSSRYRQARTTRAGSCWQATTSTAYESPAAWTERALSPSGRASTPTRASRPSTRS